MGCELNLNTAANRKSSKQKKYIKKKILVSKTLR